MTMAALSPQSRRPRFIAGGDDDETEDEQPRVPARARHECCANGCPMPGSMFPSGGRGICAWHYGTNSDDWSRITEVFRGSWFMVARELLRARRTLCDPDLCTNVRALGEAYRDGAERLRLAGGPPGLAPQDKESLSQWTLRLEAFLGARVLEVVRKPVRGDA
jgi:hypothetical protein